MWEPSSREELEEYYDRHVGEELVIVGNGPSVDPAELRAIPFSMYTLGLNRAWELWKSDACRPFTYHALGDGKQAEHVARAFRGYGLKEPPGLFTTRGDAGMERFPELGTRIRGITELPKRFSFDAVAGFHLGNTIAAFGVQLAVWMGFSRIYLMGIDCYGSHFYGGEDVPAKKWGNQRETFGLFAGVLQYERPELEIVNLSERSELKVFQKRRFEDVFGRK